MIKRILFIGNSITEGKIGIGYINIIQRSYPEFQCDNFGRGGDTLSGIFERLLKLLKATHQDYDIIVIEAGHNDLFLPYVKKKWKFTSSRKVTPLNKIESVYNNGLEMVGMLTKAKIIITTLSCLGEDFSSQLNQKRRFINDKIKEIGSKHEAYLADVSSVFDKILKKSFSSYNLVDHPLNMVLDYFRSKRMNWVEKISKKRGLVLTIDGGHLNTMGAIIYAREISRTIDKILA